MELSVQATESSAVDLETFAPDYRNPCDIDSPTNSADKFYKRMLVITNLGRGLIFVKNSLRMRKEHEFELEFELKLNQVQKINLINDQMLQIEGPKTIFIVCKDRAALMEMWKLMHNEMCAKPKGASANLEHKMFDKFFPKKSKRQRGKTMFLAYLNRVS